MLARLNKRVTDERDEGFTLIELLIVIVILGILAAIVVFAIGSTRKDSVQSACKSNVKSIEVSAEAVKTKQGTYPADTSTGGDLLESAAKGGLLKAWPTTDVKDYTLAWDQSDGGVDVTAGTNASVKGGTGISGCDAP